MEEATEIEALTPDQIDAIHDCRFCTTNEGRICAWLWTNNEGIHELLEPVLITTEKYMRDSVTKTWEYEMRSTHPEVINLVADIMATRK